MKQSNKILLAILTLVGLISCDDYDQFKKEMYDQVVYIVTSESDNVTKLECDMNSTNAEYTLSIAVSGTTQIEQDIKVELVKDKEALLKYNIANFDSVKKYSLELPETKFDIPSYSVEVKSGSKDLYSLLPITIEREDLYDLYPDSVYFIPLKIEAVSNYSISSKKNNVLLRICPKNKYAATASVTTYMLTGAKSDNNTVPEGGGLNKSNKIVTPLTHNKVRMNVGVLDYNKERQASINSVTMIVTINEDNTVSLETYAPEANLLEVEMLSPPASDFLYNNRFEELQNPYNSKKKTQRFLLYYRYRMWDAKTNKWGNWVTITEATSRDIFVE